MKGAESEICHRRIYFTVGSIMTEAEEVELPLALAANEAFNWNWNWKHLAPFLQLIIFLYLPPRFY